MSKLEIRSGSKDERLVSGWSKSGLSLLLCFCFSISGCGSSFDSESAIKEVNATNAQKLVSLYQHYQRRHRGKGPKDEASFRSFISKTSTYLLDRIDVDPSSLDSLFVSDRDGKPLEIRYGLKGSDRGPSVPTVFEVEGVDGVRIVACTNMVTMEVTNDFEYQQLLQSKGLPAETL
jgi:hypothetical protein